jgi:glycosyltransferase involved in cell wall biosynthesis
MSIFVTFPGNANDFRTFGGAPYDLQNALNEIGETAGGLDLSPSPAHPFKRYAWNLKEAMLLRGIGGYQYSDCYLNDIWRHEQARLHSGVLINLFPLFNTKLFDRHDLKKVFYVDQTLVQLYDNYDSTKYISSNHRAASISKEKRQYELADLVICMCQWAADSVVKDYTIPQERVAVVVPGGSIDHRSLPSFHDEKVGRREEGVREFNRSRPLRFVFVGQEPSRKGLFRFLDALKTMTNAQERVRVTVVGPKTECPVEYRDLLGVDWLGRISKDIFVDVVGAHDVGILLSTGEATGRSLREFQMLGLGVLAPNVGGSPEMVAPGAGRLIEKDDGPEQIAMVIRDLLENPESVARMRGAAWSARHEMTWNASAKNMVAQLKQRRVL